MNQHIHITISSLLLSFSMGYSAELTEKQKLPKVLTSYYAAIEAEKVDDVMAFYHSKCTLPFTPEGIRQTFAQVDYRYKITNIRYIGDDGINFVIIYREQTEFWIVKEGKKKCLFRGISG